jgi:RND family efflux transporter MFP subunit
VLEIPELEAQLRQDQAALKSIGDQVTNAQHQLGRVEAQHKVLHLEYDRLNHVALSKPGLVAQQEVDELQGRDLAAEAQVEGAKANLAEVQSNSQVAQSKLERDQALFAYARITAPFDGVVTNRYANLGTLMQAGTNSSTQALPLVQLSQEDRYRLVIPVPETYVGYIKVGDPVKLNVPALHRSFPGRVARFASDVHEQTRTMRTEVDVPNPTGVLIPGVYAEATLTLNQSGEALTVPIVAIDRQGDTTNVTIVDQEGRVEIREVKLGIEGTNLVEVLSGVKLGDEVIVSDRAGLKPGQQVHPLETPAPAYGDQS